MPPTHGRPSVLVVDDDDGIRAMLQLALSSRGFRVDAIADDSEGWVGRPDVVVLDERLRAGSAADFLSASGLDADVPVVLVTADEQGARMAATLGAAEFVRKPFDLEDLFAALDRALAGSERRTPGR